MYYIPQCFPILHSLCPLTGAEGHNVLNIFHVRDSIFLKALNHPHFLHLVSALHKKGRVRYRRKKPARQTNTLYLSSLKGKAKKPPSLPPWVALETSALSPNCQENADSRRMFYHGQRAVVPRSCCAVPSTPAAVQCCAFLHSAPFHSSSRLLLPLLLGFSVRQENSWRAGKLVFESSLVMQVGQGFQVLILITWDSSSCCQLRKLQWWHLFHGDEVQGGSTTEGVKLTLSPSTWWQT